jgi:hypothetical protein
MPRRLCLYSASNTINFVKENVTPKARVQGKRKIVAASLRKRRAGLTPRAYQARLDLCRLRNLVCMRKSQAEIAQTMGKDPAWVSRSIKRMHSDFSILHATPDENRLIWENLSVLAVKKPGRRVPPRSAREGRTCPLILIPLLSKCGRNNDQKLAFLFRPLLRQENPRLNCFSQDQLHLPKQPLLTKAI